MPLDAKLHIETTLQNEKTILKKTFCTQPFKIANVTEDKSGSELKLMLMSSSPGILDGDRYDMKIDVGGGCSLAIETQSYQRIFQMKTGATQQLMVNLQRGSSLVYLPHPLVPHQHSAFRSKSKVFLDDGYSLIWGEVISCGRKLNGEVFQLSLYHGITEIFLKNKLVVKENLLIKPTEMNLTGIGQWEGFTHQATLLYLKEDANVAFLTMHLTNTLHETNEVVCGISTLPVNGLVVRLLGNKAEQLSLLLKELTRLLQTPNKNLSKLPEAYVC